jgi:hypothetical protein
MHTGVTSWWPARTGFFCFPNQRLRFSIFHIKRDAAFRREIYQEYSSIQFRILFSELPQIQT